MAVATRGLIQGFPPDIQDYLDLLSSDGRKQTIENLARIERSAKRRHNQWRKYCLETDGDDIGPYKSTNEWLWESYRKKQAQALVSGEYAWLGLELRDDLTKREVKNAYRRQARKLHPDVGGDAESFKQLYSAYRAVLKVARSEG